LRELLPGVSRIAVVVNPANTSSAERTIKDVAAASLANGLRIKTLAASTSVDIDAALLTIVREQYDAPATPSSARSARPTGQPRDATRNPRDLFAARVR
ncbi:MAG: hypothetical protein WAN49_14145, partial [Pseudolabrys sp.]